MEIQIIRYPSHLHYLDSEKVNMSKQLVVYLIILLIPVGLLAQTTIPGGDVSGTWTTVNSPYIVTGDLKIQNLTIEPGVEVHFDADYKFDVEGTLQARGFYSDSIIFKRAAGNTSGWEGIVFKNSATASALEYCRIEGSSHRSGIYSDQATPDISHCRIVNNDADGINIKATTIEISHCFISGNTGHGIFVDNSQLTASNVIIDHNTLEGLFSDNDGNNANLTNCVIADNQGDGIRATKGVVEILNCIVYDNLNSVNGTVQADYSFIAGSPVHPGTQNFNTNPQFNDQISYTLNPGSPCIDAGNPQALYYDIYFPPSLGDKFNDVGAYGGPKAGHWYPPLYIIPQQHDFDRVSVGSSRLKSLDVKNYRDVPISASLITFIPDTPPVFSADELSTIPVGATEQLQVTFTPEMTQNYAADLQILTVAQGSVGIPVSGEGVIADIDLPLSILDFGAVLPADSSKLILPVYNLGRDTLRVTVQEPQLSVFTVDRTSLTIAPDGAVDSIRVTFMPQSVFAYLDLLLLNSNDPDELISVVPLRGNGIGAIIHVDKDALDFGTTDVGSSDTQILRISNTGNSDLTIDKISSTVPEFQLVDTTLIPRIIIPAGFIDLEVRFTPSNFVDFSGQLNIESSGGYETETIVNLLGTGLAALLTTQSQLNFGSVSLYADSLLDLIIANIGNKDLIVNQIDIENYSDSTVFSFDGQAPPLPLTVSAGNDTDITIRFEAQQVASESGRIDLTWNNPDGLVSEVDLYGVGTAPVISLSQSQLDFGRVLVPFDSVQVLTVSNLGNQTLIIESLEFLGQPVDSATFDTIGIGNALPFVIPPAELLDIPIAFAPIKEGDVTADLQLITNDPSQFQVQVALSGTGVVPELLLSTSTLNFGSLPLYADFVGQIKLSNIGDTSYSILTTEITPSIPDFSIADSSQAVPYILQPGDSLIVYVHYTALQRGSSNAQLIITTDIPTIPELRVDLNGYGMGSIIKYSPTQIDFGTVLTSKEMERELTINNTGNDTLIIDQLKFAGQPPDSLVFDTLSADLPISILPDSTAALSLVFRPKREGSISSALEIFSNDPDSIVVRVRLRGRGIASAPILSLSENDLHFGSVQVSAMSTADFSVTNIGNEDLIISNLDITDSNPDTVFQIIPAIDIPFNLQPDSSRTFTLQFNPNRQVPETGLLIIASNDPTQGQDTVHLDGLGIEPLPEIELSPLSHDFGRTLVTQSVDKVFYIYNHGYANLTIPIDSVYFDSGPTNQFSIIDSLSSTAIMPAASDSITIRFHPQNLGLFEEDLRISSNDPENPVQTITLTGIGYIDETASIIFDPLLSSNTFVKNQTATISFIINDVSVIDSAIIYLRQGGEQSYSAYPLTPHVNGQNWYIQIAANQITERGLEYYVSVFHTQDFTLYPIAGAESPVAVTVNIPVQQFPQQTKQEIYQMVSIPFSTGGADMASTSMFGDDLGTYDDTKYRVFEVINGTAYAELRNLNKPLPAGKAVWLITKNPMSLDVSNGTSIQTDVDFELDLEQGWNLISTPFAFPIAWSTVTSEFALRHYSGSDWEFANTLSPYTGYAVYVPNDTLLLISPVAAPLQKGKSVKQDGWQIQISARTAHFSDQYNYAGVRPDASDGIDRFDYREPLPIGEYVMLYLLPDNSKDPYSTLFKKEDQPGYRFNFEINSTISGLKAIDFNPSNLPSQLEWAVISPETNVNYGNQNIEVSSNSSRFQLIVGTPDYISDIVSGLDSPPREFNLTQNFPNPFNPNTTIEFKMPSAGRVSVFIYNILGQKVSSLLNSEYKEPGTYRLVWDGHNSNGEQAASGIYILYLKSKKYKRSIKMILQR
jgi:hypothetical protein